MMKKKSNGNAVEMQWKSNKISIGFQLDFYRISIVFLTKGIGREDRQ